MKIESQSSYKKHLPNDSREVGQKSLTQNIIDHTESHKISFRHKLGRLL